MEKSKIVELFQQLKATRIDQFLDGEQVKWTKYLVDATEPVVIHRAQGRLKMIEEMLSLLRP